MLNERRELIIKRTTTTVITAYEYSGAVSRATAPFLTRLAGWDDFDNVEVDTVPKLTGRGSFIIGTGIGEREVIAEININNATDVKSILNTFKSYMMNFNDLGLERVYKSASGAELRRETLVGLLTSVGWDRKGINATLRLTFKCVEPGKRLYLNGSTTPEEGFIL